MLDIWWILLSSPILLIWIITDWGQGWLWSLFSFISIHLPQASVAVSFSLPPPGDHHSTDLETGLTDWRWAAIIVMHLDPLTWGPGALLLSGHSRPADLVRSVIVISSICQAIHHLSSCLAWGSPGLVIGHWGIDGLIMIDWLRATDNGDEGWDFPALVTFRDPAGEVEEGEGGISIIRVGFIGWNVSDKSFMLCFLFTK